MIDVATFIFAAFFIPTAVALYFHRHTAIRRLYMAYLLVLICIPGLGLALWHWPFFSWHLYATRTGTEVTFSELRVAEADGDELKYDARAMPPTSQTPLVRFAQRIQELEPEEAGEFAEVLLQAANRYADDLQGGRPNLLERLRFPRHQFGFQWSHEDVAGVEEFIELRVYEVQAQFSNDGRAITSVTEELKAVWP